LLLGINEVLEGVPIVGGAASSLDASTPTFQFSGDECRNAAVSGVRLSGRFRYRVAVTQGCKPLGRPLRVTSAHENLILEIEDRPAYSFLRDLAPAGLLDRGESAFHYLFVGFLPDQSEQVVRPGEYFVRNIVTADPDTGIIGVGDRVGEGRTIIFALREAESARKDLVRMAGELKQGEPGEEYRFGIYFNCLARGKSFYGAEGVDSGLLQEALPGVPLLGFQCNAELAPMRGVNRLFTYTGVLILVGD
jgi:small ligand-binding sensory domain FIST